MLSGEPPFTGQTAQAIVARVLTEQPRPLHVQRHTVPDYIEAAVERALEKLPADRFASAAEFAAALTKPVEYVSTRTTRAAAPPAATAGPRARLVAIGGWVAAGLLGATLLAVVLRPEPPLPVSRFSVELESNSITASSDVPAISPDGSKFVYAEEEGGLLVRRRDRAAATLIPGAQNGWSPFFSPDGRTLGFFTGFPGALRTVPINGGPVTTVVADSTYGNGGAWSEDGWLYYVSTQDGRSAIMRVRPDGTDGRVVTLVVPEQDELFFFGPSVVPGEKRLLVTIVRRRGAPDVAAIDIGVAPTDSKRKPKRMPWA
jgi:serine/threonine-protein kinase